MPVYGYVTPSACDDAAWAKPLGHIPQGQILWDLDTSKISFFFMISHYIQSNR